MSESLGYRRITVIVPCGSSKVWDSEPSHGPIYAADAYTGTPFKLNRQYAERFGDDWVILSAKYGFILPGFVIPESYEVTFNRKSTNPIAHGQLRRQVEDLRLHRYSVVVGLGGKAYREAVTAAFHDFDTRLVFPFAGLPIGRFLQETKRALVSGQPGFDLERNER
jgi:hypothetical protein